MTTRLSLHGGRMLLDATDAAVYGAMTSPLGYVLGDESAEACVEMLLLVERMVWSNVLVSVLTWTRIATGYGGLLSPHIRRI
jgi:hypothetical protein